MCKLHKNDIRKKIRPISHFRDQFMNYLDKKHGRLEDPILMCFIPKAGSTNWKKVFNAIHTKSTIKNEGPFKKGHLNLRFYEKLPRFGDTLKYHDHTYNMKNIFKLNFSQWTDRFITVRHPFDRLYSCWKDKFHHHPDLEEYEKHLNRDESLKRMKAIHKYEYKYLKHGNENEYNTKINRLIFRPDSSRVDFRAFLEYITDSGETDKGNSNKKRRTSSKFKGDDIHWASYLEECAPCQAGYNLISKLEDVGEESEFIMKKLNAPKRIGAFPISSFHSTSKKIAGKVEKGEKNPHAEVFRKIDPDLVMKVYKKYYYDFLLFDYSVENYLNKP